MQKQWYLLVSLLFYYYNKEIEKGNSKNQEMSV